MTTILCIDDEPLFRANIAEEMQDQGFDVLEASDGREGLETILKHRPDLVICDIIMPRMDGLQLLKEVRQNYKLLADMPIIFLSALADHTHVVAGLRQGADSYLTKPVDYDVLGATVEANLRRMELIKHRMENICVLDS